MAWTINRKSARIVLLDSEQRIFLVNASDPIDPNKPDWWEIPGGGIDAGEDSAQAALRELYEETGIEGVEMGPCIWTQYVEYTFGGLFFKSHDFIHVARCEGGNTWQPKHLESLEAAAFEDAKWWEVDALMAETFPVLPVRMREFLPDIIDGKIPSEPIDIAPPLEPREES